MKRFDAAVIGGGILGCFAARNLRRWNISTVLLEENADVCMGITRANSAIVYAGYDNRPGSLKAQMTVRGNADFDRLCQELDVPFSRCGSLLVSYDETSAARLKRKLQHGLDNGVPGLRLLDGKEAEAMEPMLQKGVVCALYAPTTGTVNPWQLGIAAYENALHNGASAMLNTRVLAIREDGEGFRIQTAKETVLCKVIVNCAGLYADRVHTMLCPCPIHLQWDSAEFMVLDEQVQKPAHVIFHQAKSCGKGITAIPCTEGNLLLSGVRQELTAPFITTQSGLRSVHASAKELFPTLDLQVIRSFGAVRPNPETKNGDSLPDFCIENPKPGFYSLLGIKTPGLTCANELGAYVAQKAAAHLQAESNPDFDPRRKGILRTKNLSDEALDRLIRKDANYGQIICQCNHITRGEVLEAISRGVTTIEGVKRRLGTGMGRCQGARCGWQIGQILHQSGFDPEF